MTDPLSRQGDSEATSAFSDNLFTDVGRPGNSGPKFIVLGDTLSTL